MSHCNRYPTGGMVARGGVASVTFGWVAAAALIAFAVAATYPANTDLSLFFLHRQDRWLLLAGSLLLSLSLWNLSARAVEFHATWRLALIGTGIMALAAYVGHYSILSGYDMSRDEQMATFDAAVFARNALVAPLPEIWRQHSDALNTMFMYRADPRAAWISDYLPLNASLRAIVGTLAPSTLTGPLLTLIGGLALWSCVRRIWPDEREPAVVGLLLYLCSAQILVNGMTAYAMPGHLAFNLVWLRLFLHRQPWSDAAALVTGFAAVGLHQPIMHPLFAAPILSLLLFARDWRRSALYFVGYLAIGCFWYWWPTWIVPRVSAGSIIAERETADYLTRLWSALENGGDFRIVDMMANLLRFIAWEHILLIPLALIGLRRARHNPLVAALAGGILLTIVVMTIILPYQGHGFGYRYLHGLIGNFILLALFGWTSIGAALPRWRSLLLRTTLAGTMILLPTQLWMAHAFYSPPARISHDLDRIDADYVIIGAGDAPFVGDLVINPPFLDRRPLRLLRERVDIAAARAICANRPSVAVIGDNVTAPIVAYFGFGRGGRGEAANRELALVLRRAGCRIVG